MRHSGTFTVTASSFAVSNRGHHCMRNSVPKLLNTIRSSLKDIAAWVDGSRALTNVWRDGKFQPKDPERVRLVKAVRVHAARLLALADAVEREGHERTATHHSSISNLFLTSRPTMLRWIRSARQSPRRRRSFGTRNHGTRQRPTS